MKASYYAIAAFCVAPALVLSVAVAADHAAVASMQRRWQGSWLVRNAEFPGSVEAWSVEGDTVAVYDPVARRTDTQQLVLESPCRLVRKRSIDSGEGQTVSTTNTFAFAPDGLHIATADAPGGQRVGDTLIACIGDHVYTYDTRTQNCQKWNDTMTGSPLPASECVFDATPPSFVLRRFETGSNDVRLNLDGDALLSPGLAAQVTERQPSFGAARQRADALLPH